MFLEVVLHVVSENACEIFEQNQIFLHFKPFEELVLVVRVQEVMGLDKKLLNLGHSNLVVSEFF